MKKIFATLIAIVAVFSMAALSSAADENITRDQLAELLIRTLGLENQLPDNFNDMSAAEAYAAQIQLLSDNGILSFVGTSSDAPVTKGDLAQAIYGALSAKDETMSKELDMEGIMQALADRGLMEMSGGSTDLVNEAMLLNVLNNPLLLEDIALAYQRPASSVE